MTDTETRTQPTAEPRGGGEGATGSRRKLTEEQEREVTRLYAETETPVSEISKRFGIGESSVYRVAQRHGASLRGRTSTSAAGATSTPRATGAGRRGRRPGTRTATGSTAAATGTGTGRRGRRPGSTTGTGAATAPANGRRRRGAAATSGAATSTGTGRGRRGAARTTTTGARRGRRPGSTASAASTGRGATSGGARSWRVSFTATRVFNAASMADAIRQAEAAGATEIVGVARND